MGESKYSNFLTGLLIAIIVAIVGLSGYLGFVFYKNHVTQKGASEFTDSFTDQIGEISGDSSGNTTDQNESGNVADLLNATTTGTATGGKEKVMYKEYEVVGTIEIPKTNVKYPVLDKITKGSLETSVVRLYPDDAELNTPGNVVIIGHNYRNGLFFSNNKKLSNGDKIYITDLSGNKETYVIYNKFETTQEDTSFYNRDTAGAKEITLSTCNDDSSLRIILEAKAE